MTLNPVMESTGRHAPGEMDRVRVMISIESMGLQDMIDMWNYLYSSSERRHEGTFVEAFTRSVD